MSITQNTIGTSATTLYTSSGESATSVIYFMNDHSADEDVISPFQVHVTQAMNVQVHQLQIPFPGQHSGHREQAQRRHRGRFGHEWQSVLETPERCGCLRTDQKNFHIMFPSRGLSARATQGSA